MTGPELPAGDGGERHLSLTRTVTARIACDALTVYRAVSDVIATARYSDEVLCVVWASRSDPFRVTVGDTFTARNHAGASSWTSHSVVTAADPGRRFAFCAGGPDSPSALWCLDLRTEQPSHQPASTVVAYTVKFSGGRVAEHDMVAELGGLGRTAQRLDYLAASMEAFLGALSLGLGTGHKAPGRAIPLSTGEGAS